MAQTIDRAFILAEIRRVADESGGNVPGRRRFEVLTGIREADVARYWVRWSEAVREVGYQPNEWQGRTSDDALLDAYVSAVRELGHVPVRNELRLIARTHEGFPDHKTFMRYGGNAPLIQRARQHVEARADWADVAAILATVPVPATDDALDSEPAEQAPASTTLGVVYLIKSGRHFKIGYSNSAGRRTYEVGLQTPEPVELVHTISTDDPPGIEAYWHRRFASSRTNGEWFRLTADDVVAFKRRSFM